MGKSRLILKSNMGYYILYVCPLIPEVLQKAIHLIKYTNSHDSINREKGWSG